MIGDVYMKSLLINGSPRTNGCTFTVLTELKNTLEKEGIDAEIIHVGHKDIHGLPLTENVRKQVNVYLTIL